MFMTASCWERWLPRFEAQGHSSIGLEWPGRDFQGRDHLTIVERGWEGVADFALSWLGEQGV